MCGKVRKGITENREKENKRKSEEEWGMFFLK